MGARKKNYAVIPKVTVSFNQIIWVWRGVEIVSFVDRTL